MMSITSALLMMLFSVIQVRE